MIDIKCSEIEVRNGITPAVKVRIARERECFPFINRGQLWYDTLTAQQKDEFSAWYHAWLDAPQTLAIPEKPAWLE